LHGEAISLGLVAACGISVKKAGLPTEHREKVVSILQHFDLPTRLPKHLSHEKILAAVQRDKKFESGQVRFVVTPQLGSARLATDISIDDIREAIAGLF
ncbi:MAG: 3-dehydroquinate synthase, partial [Verrucomicrobiota bacterium]